MGDCLGVDAHLSPAASRALALAGRYAAWRSAPNSEPFDLLAALLADEDGHVRAMLREWGADVDALLTDVPTATWRESELPAAVAPAGDELREILARANQLAVAFSRHEPAGTEELLAAFLELSPEGMEIFQGAGVDVQAILERYHRDRQPEAIPVEPSDVRLGETDAAERIDLARMVDANANRLREALRVLEDYARFVLDDGGLSGRLKECRHQLREALAFLPNRWLLAARDTAGDVGTGISTAAEHFRADLKAVVTANCKRAQESCRTLEECSKVESANAAHTFEQLRYRLYSFERRFRITSHARERLAGVALYWLADPEACVRTLKFMVEQALAGGVQVVQLRDKTCDDRELVRLARELRVWTAEAGALLIINDRPDIARLVQADGVHVGQEDLSVKDARRIVGPDALIGVSTHDIEQARAAVDDGADYLGVGPVFPSRTKSFEGFPGLDFVRQVADEIALPFFCIGGIDLDNVDQVLQAGARLIAVGAILCHAEEPMPIARTLRDRLESGESA